MKDLFKNVTVDIYRMLLFIYLFLLEENNDIKIEYDSGLIQTYSSNHNRR